MTPFLVWLFFFGVPLMGILVLLGKSPVMLSPLAVVLLGVVTVLVTVLPLVTVLIAAGSVLLVCALDALAARPKYSFERPLFPRYYRGVESEFEILANPMSSRLRIRQPATPDLEFEDSQQRSELVTVVRPWRRGAHHLPKFGFRSSGPLRLAYWYGTGGLKADRMVVFPDLPAAKKISNAVAKGRFSNEGLRKGQLLGLGTDFESVREYSHDDDLRQVNWLATARYGKPMSNQYRLEKDRDVLGVIDCGRLMSAPIGNKTRLDVAMDVQAALLMVADVMGDRSGALAFDSEVLRHVKPRRAGSDSVIRATFDLEPSEEDSNYDIAFRTVNQGKRSFVCLFTDLLDESAAKPLLEAIDVLTCRHFVVVTTVKDPSFEDPLGAEFSATDVYKAAAAADAINAKREVMVKLRAKGARVIEETDLDLPKRIVTTYLNAKVLGQI